MNRYRRIAAVSEGYLWDMCCRLLSYSPKATACRAVGAERANAGNRYLEHIPHFVPIPCATDGKGQCSTNKILT